MINKDMTFGEGVFAGIAIASVIWTIITLAILLSNSKFCPECGRRYITDVSYCKYDGTELKTLFADMRGKTE